MSLSNAKGSRANRIGHKFLIRGTNPVMAGHRVQGAKLLPGLSYIDLIHQFFRRQDHAFADLELCNLAIHRPMVLSGDEDMQVEIEGIEIRAGVWQIFIDGTRELAGQPVGERLRYAVGEMHRNTARFADHERMPDVAAAGEQVDVDRIYAEFRERGLVQSGFMQVQGFGFSTLTHAFADVRLGPEARESSTRYMFHPALLDGAVTCVVGMLSAEETDADRGVSDGPKLYIPMSYDAFRADALIRDRCIAVIDYASLRRRQDICLVTVEFFDPDGRKLGVLRNLALKAVRREDAMGHAADAGGTGAPERARADGAGMGTAAETTSDQDASGAVAERGAGPEAFMRDLIAGAIAARIGVPAHRISHVVGYYEMGLDSFGLLQLVRQLEDWLDVSLSPTLFFEYSTINELVEHLSEQYADALARVAGRSGEIEATFAAVADTAVERLPVRQQVRGGDNGRDIAIIGMAGRFPMARNLRELWRNLEAGRDCVGEIPPERWDWHLFDGLKSPNGHDVSRWGGFVDDVDCFDARFFRITPRAAELTDPQERLFLEVAWEAIEDAGHTPKTLADPHGPFKRRAVGVFAGAMHKDYLLWQAQGLSDGAIQPLSMSNAPIANRVSYFCNFHGPSVVVDTLCSSSLTAVHLAVESLRTRECDVAIAGGVNLSLHPGRYLTFALLGMQSSDGRCRAFGADGDGYVSAEGVGAVVLKPLACALADGDDIRAVIRASGANHVGAVSGISVPGPVSQADLIANCLADAGMDPESIGYVEAHGTGTSLGDPIEIEGLAKAFRLGTDATGFCAIGSIKSNIGHAESAAGIAGLIKLVLQMQHRQLVPSLHAEHLNPHVRWQDTPFVVQTAGGPWHRPQKTIDGRAVEYPRRGAVSSFGAAGSNAHVVVEEFEETRVSPSMPDRPAIVPLSAQTVGQLRIYAERLSAYLREAGGAIDLHRVACTLQVGRERFAARAAFVVDDLGQLRQALDAFLRGEPDAERRFVGDDDAGMEGAARPAVEDLAAEAVRRLVGEQGASAVARRWAEGAVLDWRALYPEGAPIRVSLPTYPFARERYWLDRTSASPGVVFGAQPRRDRHAGAAHPLLHENTSDLDEQRYTAFLDARAFFLRDHLVRGAHVLPGVAYLEMAQAALKLATGAPDARHSLRNVAWQRPFVVGAETQALHVSVHRTVDGTLGYEIYSGGAGERTVHFQGAADHLAADEQRIDIGSLAALCDLDLAVDECYRLLEAGGLDYGASFRAIRSLRAGREENGDAFAIAELALPDAAREGAARFDLHPSIADAALHASIGLLLAQARAGDASAALRLSLPYALERMDVYAPCNGDAIAIVREAPGGGANLRKLDVTICDRGGDVLVRFRGFTSRLLDKPVASSAEPSASDPEATEGADDLHTFVEEWHATPLQPDRDAGTGRIVCLIPEDRYEAQVRDVADAIASEVHVLRAATLSGALVEDGDAAGGSAADLRQALAHLAEHSGPLDAIVAFWPVNDPAAVADYRRLVGLLQDVASADLPKLRIVLVAICRTPLERAYVDSWIALAPSLKRSLPHRIQVVGVLPDSGEDEDIDALVRNAALHALAELQDPASTCVFYEPGVRLARRIVPAFRTQASPLLREGATYLITGGLGGLGAMLAERLAREYRANLVLLGRSSPGADAEDLLGRLRAQGVAALYVQADVADEVALRDAVSVAGAELGPIAGVFHAAGVAARELDGLRAPFAEFERVLSPKVAGTLAIDAVLADAPPDFVCYYASSSAVLGDFGACAYAIANRFQATYAQHAGGARYAIEWPLWREGGIGVGDDAATDLYLESSGQRAIEADEGLDRLAGLLADRRPRQLVLAGERDLMLRLLAGTGVEVAGVARRIDAQPLAASVVPDNDPVARHMLRYLRGLLGNAIKLPVDRVMPHVPFDDYGFDSILALQMTKELENSLGSLPKTLFFEHQDLLSLNRYLVQHHRAAAAKMLGVDGDAVETAPQVQTRALRARAPAAVLDVDPTGEREKIAIVGISGRFPGSSDMDALWDNLREGVDCITEVPSSRWDREADYDPGRGVFGKHYCRWGGFLEDIDLFDALFFNMTPAEAQFVDPQQRLFLETVWTLLESGGFTRESLQKDYGGRVGVYVGSMYNDYGDVAADTASGALCTAPQAGIANRVSYFFGLGGPSVAIDTMCSSALTAIHMACADLRQGACSLAIAGGVNLTIHPKKYIALSQGQMLASHARARSFGATDGFLPAEAVGAVLLKPLRRAIDDGDEILAVIRGSALNHGGRSNGYSVPNPVAQAQAVEEALRDARVEPGSIGYVEAAANGSPLGDAIEMVALRNAFVGVESGAVATGKIPIGAVKSNVGHAEAASGMIQLAKVLLQLRHRTLAPSILADPPNPNIRFEESPFRLQTALEPWAVDGPRRALINSFGAGGANACLVVEEYTATAFQAHGSDSGHGPQVVVLSAKSSDRLKALARNLREHVEQRPALALVDVAHTLQCGREAMSFRLAMVVDSREQLIEALAAYLTGSVGATAGQAAIHVGGQAESAAFNSFTSGSAGDVLIDTFVRERDLEKLAMFWAYGGNVPWDALHPRRRPIVPLPGYPFARERCWVPVAPPPADARGSPPRAVRTFQVEGGRAVPIVHPMLHVNSSDLSECRFSTRFDGDEIYAVRDNVRGLRLIPAAVYFEMMRAAIAELVGRAHRAGEMGAIRLTGVEWYGPRDIDAEPVTLHVSLRAAGSNRIECEVYSMPAGQGVVPSAAEAEARALHCRATAWLASSPAALESMDLPSLRARATGQITTAQWYEALTRIGFEYGPAYAETGIVRSGAGDDGRAFFVAELNASPDPDADRYGLPPLVLNTALQAASLLIAGVGSKDDGSVAALPTTYRCRELTLLAPLPAAVVVHVHDAAGSAHSGSGDSGDDDAALIDIDICDEAGSLLVRFAGVGGLEQHVAADAGDGVQPAKREFNATPLRMLANRDIVAPRNALEETLQEIWQEVIGFAPIGVFDNFLDIGGNSLIATQVIMRTNEYYQVDIQASALLVPEANIAYFSTLVVAELARQASESV